MDTKQGKPPRKAVKWLKEILFLLSMVAISAIIAFVLFRYQDTFKVSLKDYGWLAYIIVFVAATASSATILVPAPGVAFTLAAAAVWDPSIVAIAAGTGDALGELTGWWVGYVGGRIVDYQHLPAYAKAAAWTSKYGVWAVFGDALVPIIPYDLIGMAAGALKIKWWKFFLATWGGKLPRAFLAAYLGHQIPFLMHMWGGS